MNIHLNLSATSSGILKQHPCKGESKTDFFVHGSQENCDMEMDDGMMDDCCDNEMTLEIIEDSQQLVQIEKAPQADYFLLYATALILTADLQ